MKEVGKDGKGSDSHLCIYFAKCKQEGAHGLRKWLTDK